jgi:hypothetical protein
MLDYCINVIISNIKLQIFMIFDKGKSIADPGPKQHLVSDPTRISTVSEIFTGMKYCAGAACGGVQYRGYRPHPLLSRTQD